MFTPPLILKFIFSLAKKYLEKSLVVSYATAIFNQQNRGEKFTRKV